MRIVNFNRRDKRDKTQLLNTYIDGNKQYCYDLNRKITSLYDYMIWNYPEYLIFNAPTSLSGKDDFEPYKSLVSCEVEPRLVKPYERYIQVESNDENHTLTTVSIFFPSRLNFHQGFYNQSIYGDGYLIELTDWKRHGYQCYKMSNSYYLDFVDFNSEANLEVYKGRKYIVIGVTDTTGLDPIYDNIVYGQIAETSQGEKLVASKDYTGKQDMNTQKTALVLTNANKYSFIEIGYYEEPLVNFPAGYICILNKQPTGLNNEQNPIKNDLSSYLIAPIGNGGYYNIWGNNDVLQADYKANELNNFSNKITINLAQNCRYINPSQDAFCFQNNSNNITIPNGHIDNNTIAPQLTDKHQNIGTGQEDLVAQTYLSGEKVFADVQYDSFLSVVKQQNVHNLNAHIEEPFSLKKVDLLIY